MSGAEAHDQKVNVDKIDELEARATAAEAAVDTMEGQEHKQNKDGGELLASGSTLLPIKRQRIQSTIPLQIVDADWGTSLSRLRYQLQDESPLYPEGLSSEESSDTVEAVEE